jgi:hypothetical protein
MDQHDTYRPGTYHHHNYHIGTAMGHRSYRSQWKNRVKLVKGAIMAETVLLRGTRLDLKDYLIKASTVN